MSFRTPIDLADAIADAAAAELMNGSDYLVRVVARVHGYPLDRLAPATPRRTAPHAAVAKSSPLSDPDVADAIEALQRSIERSGLTPAEFSVALGMSSESLAAYSSTLVELPAAVERRAHRVGTALQRARHRDWMTSGAAGRTLSRALADADQARATRVCARCGLDLHRAFTEDPEAVPAWEVVPAATGTGEWDTLLAAVVEHGYDDHGRRPPAWASVDSRSLDTPWVLPANTATALGLGTPTPYWLACRNIHVAEPACGRTDLAASPSRQSREMGQA